jgi:O-antigen/teichoic acid export membrane protein
VADQVAARSNEVIVSGALGFHSAGLLSKSQSLIGSFNDFFASALANVAMPALTKVRHEGGSIVEPFLRGTVLIAPVLWIFFGLLGVFAHEVIYLMFGPQWMECVPLLHVMSAASLLWGPYMLAYPLITSMRLVGPLLRIQLTCAPLTIACIFLGASFGLVWVAVVPLFAMLVRLCMTQRVLTNKCGIPLFALLRSLLPSGVSCALTIGVAIGLKLLLTGMALPSALVLAVGSLGTVAFATALAAGQNHPIWQEIIRLAKGVAYQKVASSDC